MHPRSPYQEFIDFRQLAEAFPKFAKFLKEPSTIDFKDPAAVRALAECLLARDFNLTVQLREDRLCPMIPNRLDYVLWIQDLIDTSGEHPLPQPEVERSVMGLDIGAGASCIYPLLICTERPSWEMIGTDIDAESVSSARKIIEKNTDVLGERIKIYKVNPEGPLFPLDELGIKRLDFTMCNPPFFTSIDDMLDSAKKKGLPPSSACTGTTTEMVYEKEGEVGFARRMLEESKALRERVQWYTTLFGKLSSVHTFVADLKTTPEISGNWAVTSFIQGTTKRWAVAWSYCDRRPSQAASVQKHPSLKGCSPFPPELSIEVPGSTEELTKRVQELVKELRLLRYEWMEPAGAVFGEVAGDVWSRSARRAAQRGVLDLGEDVKLGFLIIINPGNVTVSWTRGRDTVLFESFCGMLKRKLSG